MSMAENLERIKERIARAAARAGRSPAEITLVAVSKMQDLDSVRQAVSLGITDIGENWVQEAEPKIETLRAEGLRPKWHMIGHLQSNKARAAVRLFDVIESVDTIHLAETISRLASRTVPILVEVNVAGEATKSGIPPEDVADTVGRVRALPNLQVLGLMTIAPMVADPEQVRPVFRQLREIARKLDLQHLSMGMTDDYEVAIEEGATIVRIGRAIFGQRKEEK